jgi:hypothetical protein
LDQLDKEDPRVAQLDREVLKALKVIPVLQVLQVLEVFLEILIYILKLTISQITA